MPVVSVGDMARQFTSMRSGTAIKTELGLLSKRMSTGKVDDITAHLGGQTARFSGVNHSLSRLDSSLRAASETSLLLRSMQTVLQRVDSVRAATSQQLLLVTPESLSSQVEETAKAARGSFETIVSALNTQFADRALMGGANVDGPPLASAENMLADLRAFIGGATAPGAVIAAIEVWFDDPAGGFATMGYLGDTGEPLKKRLTDDQSVRIDARADDPAIKATLKAAGIAAMANDLPGLSIDSKSVLLQDAGVRFFGAASGLVGIQERIGFVEESVDLATVAMTAQRTTLAISRNELISADPFDTASRLQAVQLQLETHYTVTARMSQLSLLGYI